MEDEHKHNTLSPKLIATLAVMVLVGGSAMAWWANKSFQSSPQPISQTIPNTPNIPKNSPISAQTENLEVYWLDNNLQLVATPVSIQKANNKETSLENLFKVLLAGKPEGNNGTTIPDGTKILSLKVAKDGIHLNLSPEFLSGGGSDSMTGRLGQIIYTATSLNPDAEVWIDVNGQPLEELGGEGILVEQPMTRKLFQESFAF